MTFTYESRCLICDHFWTSSTCTDPCPNCGETDDIYSKEKKEPMTVTEALQLIEDNKHIPALNYCINYAHYALQLDQNSHEFKVQLLYVLNNMTHWRQCKASTTTAAEIRECRATLKKASE